MYILIFNFEIFIKIFESLRIFMKQCTFLSKINGKNIFNILLKILLKLLKIKK